MRASHLSHVSSRTGSAIHRRLRRWYRCNRWWAGAWADKKVNLAITGSPLSIKFKISSHSKFSGISFSIGFFNASEGFLTACKSDAIQKVFDIEKGDNTLEFSFDKLPLSSGRYIFNLAAYNGSEILDWIKGAGSFDVENGDFYGSGILPAIGKQGVFVEYDWAKA